MSNIYLYYGSEGLIIKNKIDRLVKESQVDEFNINIYDLEEVSILTALADAVTMPFLIKNKVVIIKNPLFLTSEKTLSDKELKEFQNYLERPMESTYFVIDATNLKLDERKDVVKRLKKITNAVETKELTDVELVGWVKRQCDINGVSIKDDAVKLFFNIAGKNLLNARNEIDKLIAYVDKGGTITVDDVEKVTVKEIQNDVFAITNAIIEQNKPKIIKIYQDLIESGNDIFYIFSLVQKSMRETLLVKVLLQEDYKQAEIASRMKVSPGRAYYMMKNARSLNYNVVEDYVIKLGNLDYQIKSGQIDIRTGFEFFLFGI